MLDVILDLYHHMEWADAEHWRAILAHEPARQDPDLRERLLHLHGAQQIWLGRWQGLALPWPAAADHESIEDVRHFAAACHAALRAFLLALKAEHLARDLSFTTLKGEAVTQNLGDTLIQVPMHSHYHRGQNATRMRAMGGAMPGTDWALWTRKGRPAPQWPEVAP